MLFRLEGKIQTEVEDTLVQQEPRGCIGAASVRGAVRTDAWKLSASAHPAATNAQGCR